MAINLIDIDEMFPCMNLGSMFSDLYMSVYGICPRGITFEDMEDFEQQESILQLRLEEIMADDQKEQKRHLELFLVAIEEIREYEGCTYLHAIVRHADSDDLGYIEYDFDLPYGSLSKFLRENGEL